MTASGEHGAAGAALGYLYQTKLALLHLLQADREVPGAGISLELFDDVAWDAEGLPLELVQAKHTVRGGAGLGDAASEWWSAVRVWLDAGPVSAADAPRLVLVSNAVAAPGTALHALRPASRDEEDALRLLSDTARSSKSAATQATRDRFLALPATDQRALLARIRVLDGAPDVSSVDDEVAGLLRWVAPVGREAAFLAQIWGRWWEVAVALLRRELRSITGEQWRFVINDVRDGFTLGRLVTTVSEVSEETEAALAEDLGHRTFVRQLEWVEAPHAVLRACLVDYYRAAQQQHEWAEDSLLGLHEFVDFQRRLKHEWSLAFNFAVAELDDHADERAKQRVGRYLLQQLLDQARVFLRNDYREPFLSRGALHELADRQEVGWHPDFEAKLAALLLEAS